MNALFKLVLRGVLLLAGAACSYVLAALLLGGASVHADRNARTESEDGINVYLHSNGVHTDLMVPMKNAVFDWHGIISPADTANGAAAEYAAIGWGSREFYLNVQNWNDLTAASALRAALGADGSLMHVTFLPAEPSRGRRTLRLKLSEAEYARLTAQIRPYFQTDGNGRAQALPDAGYGGNDAFYPAEGRYHLFYTCNTWTNQRLKKSGLKAVVWTPFAYSVMAAYD